MSSASFAGAAERLMPRSRRRATDTVSRAIALRPGPSREPTAGSGPPGRWSPGVVTVLPPPDHTRTPAKVLTPPCAQYLQWPRRRAWPCKALVWDCGPTLRMVPGVDVLTASTARSFSSCSSIQHKPTAMNMVSTSPLHCVLLLRVGRVLGGH